MDRSRRRLLQAGLIGGAAAAGGVVPGIAAGDEQEQATGNALRILVLGGTGFIGPHMVREFLRRGHRVSLFNRGRTNNALFPDLERFIGDRDNGLDALKGHSWDAVVDNSGYVPRHVADSSRLLSPVIAHYVFVSTISVYASFAVPNDEDSALGTMPDESVEEVTGETYGPMKALCEQRARRAIGEDRLTILRPTYICGPGDRTDRFTYWPVRSMRGGDMLWPGNPADPIQIIDVRDLANFVADCIEQRITGIYNTVIPVGSYHIGQLQQDCAAVTAAAMTPVWVEADFLRRYELLNGLSLPIWSPPDGELAGVAQVSGARAAAQGLVTRPPRETCRDTVAWWKTLPAERQQQLHAGLEKDKEIAVLDAWKRRTG